MINDPNGDDIGLEAEKPLCTQRGFSTEFQADTACSMVSSLFIFLNE